MQRRWRGGHVATSVYQDVLLQHAFPGCKVLHAGCGRDRSGVAAVLRERAGARIFGFDLDHDAVRKNVNASGVANLENIPVANDVFDLVIMEYVVEHLERPETVFAELNRVLAPGGTIVFLTPNAFSYKSLVARMTPQRFHEAVGRRRYGDGAEDDMYPTTYRANSRRALERVLQNAGLQLRELNSISNGPTWFVGAPGLFGFGCLFHTVIERFTSLAPLRCALIGTAAPRRP